MAYTPEVEAAIARLQDHYNGDAYDQAINPGGMGEGGHRQNFEPALDDVGAVAEAAGALIDAADLPDIVVRSDEFRARFLGNLPADPAPASSSAGQWYYNTSSNATRIFNGVNWVALATTTSDYVPASGGIFAGPIVFDNGLTGDVTGDLAGKADRADELETARTFSISGAGLTGDSAIFDGTDDVSLGLSVDNDGHTHTLSTIVDRGTITSQDANNVDIDGGTIDGTQIGEAAPASAKVTTLDANGATNLGSTLDVTGAATLQSTLGVTGASTFTAASTHNGGVKTNSVTGVSGTTVIEAPAGQSVEIKVGGTKKAEITDDGDVIADSRLFAGSADIAEFTISSVPSSGAFKGANLSQGYLEGLTFASVSGRFTVQHAGTYRVTLHLAAAGSSHSPEGAIYKYPAGGGAVQASRQGSSSGTGMNTDVTMIVACAVNEYFEIHNMGSSSSIGTDNDESWVVIERF